MNILILCSLWGAKAEKQTIENCEGSRGMKGEGREIITDMEVFSLQVTMNICC